MKKNNGSGPGSGSGKEKKNGSGPVLVPVLKKMGFRFRFKILGSGYGSRNKKRPDACSPSGDVQYCRNHTPFGKVLSSAFFPNLYLPYQVYSKTSNS